MPLGDLLQGYYAVKDRNQAAADKQAALGLTLQKLLAGQQEAAATQAFREKQLAAQGSESAARLAETAEARKSREEMAAAQLKARSEAQLRDLDLKAQLADMQHTYRMSDLDRRKATDAEKNSELARHNKAMEEIGALRASLSPETRKAEKEKEATKATGELLDELEADYGQLKKLGADISPKRGAMSNMVNRVAGSGIGQLVTGAVGTEAQSVRDSIATKRASLMASIKQATGMGATQLNSNVELQFYLKMATDPTMSREANLKAIKWLRDTYGTVKTGAAPASQSIPEFASEADAAKANLKPGTRVKINGVLGTWQ